MAMEDGEIGWFSPDPRGRAAARRVSRARAAGARAARRAASISASTPPSRRRCARAPTAGDEGTWITDEILESYVALIASASRTPSRCGRDGHGRRAVRRPPRRRVLRRVDVPSRHATRRRWRSSRWSSACASGFTLLDIQWVTPHLAQFGATEIPRRAYLQQPAITLQSGPGGLSTLSQDRLPERGARIARRRSENTGGI